MLATSPETLRSTLHLPNDALNTTDGSCSHVSISKEEFNSKALPTGAAEGGEGERSALQTKTYGAILKIIIYTAFLIHQ